MIPPHAVSVVHFDAHPDLSVPARPIDRAWREAPRALAAASDIASFQLGAVWVGLVSRVVWVRPEWAEQLPDGERRFHLGATRDGRLRVDDESDYYVLDDAWAPLSSLATRCRWLCGSSRWPKRRADWTRTPPSWTSIWTALPPATRRPNACARWVSPTRTRRDCVRSSRPSV